jgi:hypothetical protein
VYSVGVLLWELLTGQVGGKGAAHTEDPAAAAAAAALGIQMHPSTSIWKHAVLVDHICPFGAPGQCSRS